MTDPRNKIPHRDRKNPREADHQAKRRHEKNAARGRQVWIEDSPMTGHWEHQK